MREVIAIVEMKIVVRIPGNDDRNTAINTAVDVVSDLQVSLSGSHVGGFAIRTAEIVDYKDDCWKVNDPETGEEVAKPIPRGAKFSDQLKLREGVTL
jgi:hypothetical protein